MNTYLKYFIAVILGVFILSIFIPMYPLSIKKGWHGGVPGKGEFCGIVYLPECDEKETVWFTFFNFINAKKFNY
jgi:hypothetical protein